MGVFRRSRLGWRTCASPSFSSIETHLPTLLSSKVARLNKTTLQAYMAANIFKLPLAMYYTTFKPEAHPDPTYSKTVRSSMHYRNKKTGELTLGPSIMPIPAANDLGGSGLYSNADDFARLLLAVLQSLSNPTLPESLGISKGLLEEIFKNQLKPESGAEKGWEKILPIFRPYAMGNLPASVGVAPGLGCIVTTEDTEGMRKKGSVQWAGIPNLAYVCPFSLLVCALADLASSS
jgi:CubicO group peptidase (beta-lactamase class C family)